MEPKKLIALILFIVSAHVMPTAAAENAVDGMTETAQYMRVNIDRIVIDTQGLVIASGSLADSIDRLALAIQQLSADSEALSAEEKEILLKAVSSVDQASLALADLARQLPQTAQNLSQQLPQVIREARQPIADLSSGLQSARDGVFAITESLPQATANAKELVNSALDSALIRFSTYTIILIAVLALALIGVMWFVYRQYLDPLAQKLDSLTGAPEHFAAMSRHMKETSDNLIALQPAPAPEPPADDSPAAIKLPRSDSDEIADKSGSE
ncbi:MAG: hypothetical protein OEU50_15680 [Gammaproteobacteria bacterium]|nr:hypothetical protein [Gammaproteobacteria bacterium]